MITWESFDELSTHPKYFVNPEDINILQEVTLMKPILYLAFIVLNVILAQPDAMAQKPYNELQINHVNLKKYPEHITVHEPGVEVTIGDLHGNALKLLNFLIRNDVVKITKEDYNLFVSIYEKSPDDLTVKDLAYFQVLLNAAKINSQHKIRFLGDDLCDRGMNDYYTLQLYKKLDMAGVPFDVVLSNHGNFFLSAYERPEQSFSFNPYGEGENESTVQSMLHLGRIIDRGIIERQDVLDIIQNHYLKHLVFPGYTHNKQKNELTVYSHAPIDLGILAELAKDLKTPYNDSNLAELTKGFDSINHQIHQWIMSRTFTVHYNQLNEDHKKSNTQSPIKQVLWNRDYTILHRDHEPTGKHFFVNYVHGHDSMPNVFNLDNLFGKGNDNYTGPYAIHVTHS
ncbi:Dot/Icm T4SS effector Wip [Legionella quateirensis]|nr:Dot/Icm T4SS effector Wip [Legionella quateirensis]